MPEPAAAAAARQRIQASLRSLADAAAERGLRLAVENIGGLGTTIADLLPFIADLGPHVGLCHDVGHSVQAGLDPAAETAEALRSGRLFSLHLHDVNAANRDHFIPGEGVVDLAAILALLDEHGFTGIRTLEIDHPGHPSLLGREWRAGPSFNRLGARYRAQPTPSGGARDQRPGQGTGTIGGHCVQRQPWGTRHGLQDRIAHQQCH